MTPEEIADVLVRAGVLVPDANEHSTYRLWQLPEGAHDDWLTAEQAIADGNVAMAAWAELERHGGYVMCANSEHCDGSGGYVAQAMDGAGNIHITDVLNDRATAITTACAVALREISND